MRIIKAFILAMLLAANSLPFHAFAQTNEPSESSIRSALSPNLRNPNSASSQPAGSVRERFGEWYIVCDRQPGAPGDRCALMQNVIADDRNDVGLSVIVLKSADKKANILRILVPLGVLLPNGLGLIIDGKDLGRAYYTRCCLLYTSDAADD